MRSGGQLTLQEPGPSRCPQAPHGPDLTAPEARESAGTLTANTESCLSRSVPWHEGHSKLVDSRTRSSNW